MIKFENVSFAYEPGKPVLIDISLNISKGERVALVGGNGSGKTTFALLLNGLLRSDSGIISVENLILDNEANRTAIKRKVGLVFQNPDNQLVSTTIEREIAFSLENFNVPRGEMLTRVGLMLDLFNLTDFRNRLTSDLSGGEKQLLALAAVMVSEPEILILDEPGSYLDESGKQLLAEALDRLLRNRPDLTIIHITQYHRVAMKYERMIVFANGEISYDDNPKKLFSQAESLNSYGIGQPFEYRIGGLSKNSPTGINKKTEVTSNVKTDKTIRLNSVSFNYDIESVEPFIENINLKIENGKTYGLVGASGSGKTTLIQLLAGLLKPQRGKVVIDGFESVPGERAVVFQQPERQFFLETVEKELRFGAENISVPNIDKVVDDCYRLIGLDRQTYADRNPFTLSGGEKRKLAFGTILSLKPSFIFFDEPTCGLDFQGTVRFKEMIRALKAQAVGVVLVSHDGDIILELCDRIIAMDKGAFVYEGETKDFFSTIDFSSYMSAPEIISWQFENFGELRYYSEAQLLANI